MIKVIQITDKAVEFFAINTGLEHDEAEELLGIVVSLCNISSGADSDGAGELASAVDNLLKYRERILAMSLPHGHMLTAELAGALHDLSTARNKTQQGSGSEPSNVG